MANTNKKRKFKPGQGKTPQQYTDSTRFAWYGVVGMTLLVILLTLLGGCATTHDASKECCKSKTISAE
jgi:hypothetical protein